MKKTTQLFSKWKLSGIRLVGLLSFVSLFASAQVTTYSFTTAGVTGQNGPSQAQINTAYASTNLNGSVTVVGGIQQFTVPTTGLYRIVAAGSAAGGSSTGFGCKGRIVQGEINLTAGQVLKILVGQKGVTGSTSTGGGGGSFVATITNSLLAVGGGGGGYCNPLSSASPSSDAPYTNNGNAATGSNPGAGGTGGGGGFGAASEWGGGGGGFNGNGTAGAACGGTGGTSFVNGGTGGGTCNNSYGGFGGGGGTHGNTGGGGGGGGYSGGGGSGQSSGNNTGGGGGSYQSPNMTNLADLGTNANDGYVVITRLCAITLTAQGVNASGAICSGNSATIVTNAISSYTWSTGSNAASIVVSPTTSTGYTLTAMSPSNCIASAFITIGVNNAVPVLTVASSANSVCLNNTVSLTASGAITYTWTNGVTNGVSFSPSVTNNYVVSGQNGCGTTTAAITVSVLPLPVQGLATPTLVCSGGSASLTGTGATTYTWIPGGYTGANVLVSPLVNTTYTVTGSSGNCIGVYTLNVNTNPNPTITASASNSMICQGVSVTLTATGGNSYTWTPGGQTGSSIVVTPTAPTAYYVTGSNNFNCTSTANQAVITTASPTVSVVSNNNSICSGGTANLTASGAVSYVWNTGATTAGISVNPTSNAVYTVTGASSNSCTNTQTIGISVFVATIAVSSSTNVICNGQSVTINASGATNYQWNTGGTNSSIIVTPSANTGYTVNGITSVGGNTCNASGSTQITVNPLPVVTATSTRTNICKGEKTILTAGGANTYAWNTGPTTSTLQVNPQVTLTYTVYGTSSANCSSTATIQIVVSPCTGIDENSAFTDALNIYPNPNNGVFTVKSSQALNLNVINELGQTVQNLNLNEQNNYQVQVSNLPVGIYFLQAVNGSYKINKKVVIQN